jgi:hypothetical protein
MKEIVSTTLVKDIRLLIENARQTAAQAVNTAHILLNWHIG